jgi:TM2 domain-containing membrane protein YozV
VGDWYYIGHYGQLGPLTRDQIDELVGGGVIARDTYIWRTGMAGWVRAESVPDLESSFRSLVPNCPPPPPPPGLGMPPPVPAFSNDMVSVPFAGTGYPMIHTTRSTKSRTIGALLQIVPGFGRLYLGHLPIGILQLVLTPCGVGLVWSWIDLIYILAGGVKFDGFGKLLKD